MKVDDLQHGFRNFQKVLGCLMAFLFLFGGISLVYAKTGDELSKTANALIRSAERSMFSGKTEDALKQMEEALAGIEELKRIDPQHRQLKSLESSYNRIKAQVDRRVDQASKRQSAPETPQAGPAAADSSKLPAGVSKRLRDIERHLSNAERYVSTDSKQADYILQQADGVFQEIDRMYSEQLDRDHPDYAAVQQSYDRLRKQSREQAAAEIEARASAEASGALKEQQSAEWVTQFRAYLAYAGQSGHDPDKLVFVPGTSEPEKFAEAQKRYDEFKAFYSGYQSTDFPHGKTWELEELADKQAPERLAFFETRFSERIASVSDEVEKQIDDAMNQLERDAGWKSDNTVKPPIVDSRRMASIGESVNRAKTALGDDAKYGVIHKKFILLQEKDREHRKVRAERTFLSPDVYKGPDADELKRMAQSVVNKDKPGSKILRISVYRDAWEEETVQEWTDTTRTAWRMRTSRMIYAQVAARDAADVSLHTIYLAKDKQSDGWGTLYGHVMRSEPMLERNVNKDGP